MRKQDYKDYWVYIEKGIDGKVLPVSLELCSEARKLADAAGEKLAAVYIGGIEAEDLEKVLDCGVEKLIHVEGTGFASFNIDAWTALFTELCRKYLPSAVLVGGTINGRDFAPRFACRLPTGCTSDATQLVYDPETGDIEFIEPAVGGKMMAVITVPNVRPQVGTLRPGTFRYQPTGKRPCETVEERFDFNESEIRTHQISYKADEFDESLMIADAEYIVCVGNGLKLDQLPKFRRLAELLGGKLACTRPVFDRGILPYPLVVGQSGVVVKPKIYFAFGVSGAINHVTGIKDSEIIVAVNKDPDAAIFKYCTYGIVGDMHEVCEMLIDRLEAGNK